MATTSTIDEGIEAVSVLVVDDDPAEARSVAESLAVADPSVSARGATDVDAALESIAEGEVDCVVTDADLGDVDGFDFLDRVARTDGTVRAIVHTAEDDAAIARRAWDRGAAYARKGTDDDRYDVLARHITGDVDDE